MSKTFCYICREHEAMSYGRYLARPLPAEEAQTCAQCQRTICAQCSHNGKCTECHTGYATND